MGGVVERAKADLAAGRTWKARDRLVGALQHRDDRELLDLLGEVHFAMGDLPAAAAVWFVTGRRGQDAETAHRAWVERFGDDPLQLWLSLPRLARQEPLTEPVERLRAEAQQVARQRPTRPGAGTLVAPCTGDRWVIPLVIVIVATIAVLCGVGLWTVVTWLF